jgi:hypothetical protein
MKCPKCGSWLELYEISRQPGMQATTVNQLAQIHLLNHILEELMKS